MANTILFPQLSLQMTNIYHCSNCLLLWTTRDIVTQMAFIVLTDENECLLGTANCPDTTTCVNTEGGFSCEPNTSGGNGNTNTQCPDGTEYDIASGECQPTRTCATGTAFNTVTRECEGK